MNNCSICGWGVAWRIDKEDKGTYWMCGRCATDRIREMMPRNRALVRVARAAAVVDGYLSGMMLEEDFDDVWLEVPSRKPFRLLIEALKELPEGLIE